MTPAPSVAQWKTYGRLWIFLSPYTKRLSFVLVLSLVSTGLGLLQPYISKLLIDRALMRRDIHALAWISGALFVAVVVGFALNMLARYRYLEISAAMLFDMRAALFRHLQTLSPRFYAR